MFVEIDLIKHNVGAGYSKDRIVVEVDDYVQAWSAGFAHCSGVVDVNIIGKVDGKIC